MAISPPSERNWWKIPLHKVELYWIILAFCWGLVMFFMMIYWHGAGKQNLSNEAYKIEPAAFFAIQKNCSWRMVHWNAFQAPPRSFGMNGCVVPSMAKGHFQDRYQRIESSLPTTNFVRRQGMNGHWALTFHKTELGRSLQDLLRQVAQMLGRKVFQWDLSEVWDEMIVDQNQVVVMPAWRAR